jgi:hypothetical protein
MTYTGPAYLREIHGIINAILAVAFFFQGWLGWRIRRQRLGRIPADFARNRRHRKIGPLLAILGWGGYLAGIAVTLIGEPTGLFTWPLHLAGGSALAAALAAAFVLSRRITSPSSPARSRHALAGLAVLVLFLWQVLSGLVILL